ncbi:MAG: flagellar basal body P-ring formation chaperone FlgA [Desulfuromonadaceae bacterium]|nr:flagellar basal body P-ring formation chaperone FlgA [Desulfuromonadaceae bacterium]MDD2848136.1 flagellar basal body P-ring formation chaperone FlgA [Desulfuromonadaceae bacterium]MDD4132023.1 flagellar basal body P-ring formation chaperone FlgA [Desulfuromonadaceae bacterium]
MPHIVILFLALMALYPCQAFSAPDREQEVREAVTAFVKSRTSGMGWDVRVRRLNISGALKLPEGKIDYEIVAPQQWEGWGNISVAVLARQNDKVLRNISVRLDVEALADTVVTLQQINYGELISAADVVLQKREITYNSHLAARTIDEVVGKKSRTTLRANQPVRADQVERVPLIKSGQIVTIIAENEVLKISVSGKARSSGAEGDMIRVQNLTSLKEISARVIDASTVQVAF